MGGQRTALAIGAARRCIFGLLGVRGEVELEVEPRVLPVDVL